MWLSIKSFNIANYTKYDGYQRGLASMAFKFFDKILQLIKEQEITMENYKSQLLKILKNVHYTFVLKTAFGVHMQLKSKYNKGIQLLLCAINIFRKYA